MPIRELKPIRETPKDYDRIEAAILALFRDEIYFPLLRLMKAPRKTLQNSREDIVQAIMTGRIRFYRGQFRGEFSSSLSKELKSFGAVWDRKQGSWKVPRLNLPIEVTQAIDASEDRFMQTAKSINKKLDQILPAEIAEKLRLENLFESAVWRVEDEFQDSVKAISVEAQLTEDQVKRIAREYTQNMKLYIEEFTQKEIVKLRKDVQESAFKGVRYESMIEKIQKSYEVSRSKAKFLARQETSLLMTKFKQTRYEDAGVNQYRWQCVIGSPKHPVRPMHKALNGKIFTWDNPPVTSENGARNNPGQDYNCRCVAIPLVNFKK